MKTLANYLYLFVSISTIALIFNSCEQSENDAKPNFSRMLLLAEYLSLEGYQTEYHQDKIKLKSSSINEGLEFVSTLNKFYKMNGYGDNVFDVIEASAFIDYGIKNNGRAEDWDCYTEWYWDGDLLCANTTCWRTTHPWDVIMYENCYYFDGDSDCPKCPIPF